MTAPCPGCGFEIDTTGISPGSMVDCPGCGQSFRVPGTAPGNVAAEPNPPGTVICPICKTINPLEAKVCSRCAAILRRKHWGHMEGPAARSPVSRLPVNRRHLTTIVLCLIGVTFLAGVVWMAGSLLKGAETPSFAYRRMAGMAANGDWGRFYDRLHPKTQEGIVSMAQASGRLGNRTAREMFATEGFGPMMTAIEGIPLKDFTITKEEVNGDSATLDLKLSNGRQEFILMTRDQGIWKLRMLAAEGPGH